ncbi:MAG: YihA family ribosome biogenesis GTP-binding protein [Lachnospiraceae bacterium]|jgi:ribosome biogenesis GTP-binding protein ysxC|nr:MAG: YihA family ribosome biogenesis GTP-binding protein [Lachnospiraceae bacterium]
MHIKQAVLETVCGITSVLPKNDLPEIAFLGKSNVGKSSLINTLMQRKSLARTSQAPGKTQTINYYKVNDSLYFVDLPGYGYAKVSQELRQKWGKMIERYITTSPTLKLICLLVDIRHEPTENDRLMYDWIKYHGYKVLLILTKADKLKRSVLNKHIKMIEKALKVADEDMIVAFSSETKQGREEVYEIIDNMSVS